MHQKAEEKVAAQGLSLTCKIEASVVYLLSIYDKSEHEDITDNEIKELIKFIR